MGRREIHRNWKWYPGTDPNDDDAHPDSKWQYVVKVEEEKKPPGGPPIQGRRGPPAGMKCIVNDSCQADMFILQDYEPHEILQHLEGVGGDVIVPKVADKVVVVACSNDHRAAMRLSTLPIRRGMSSEPIEL